MAFIDVDVQPDGGPVRVILGFEGYAAWDSRYASNDKSLVFEEHYNDGGDPDRREHALADARELIGDSHVSAVRFFRVGDVDEEVTLTLTWVQEVDGEEVELFSDTRTATLTEEDPGVRFRDTIMFWRDPDTLPGFLAEGTPGAGS